MDNIARRVIFRVNTALIRVNGRYNHHTPLLHDNEQIWKFARAAKEDKHARAFTGRET